MSYSLGSPRLTTLRGGLAHAVLVVSACLLAFLLAASGWFGAPGRFEPAVGGLVLVAVLTLITVRHPGWLPAALLALVSLIPYQVSFVGKTPFGVVSFTGLLAVLAVATLFLAHGRGSADVWRQSEVLAMTFWGLILLISAAGSADSRLSLNAARTIIVAMPLAYLAGRLVAKLDPKALGRVAVVAGVLAGLAVVEELTPFTPYAFLPETGFPLVPPPEAIRSGLERVRLGYYHGSTLGTVLAVALAVVVLHRRFGAKHRRWLLPTLVLGLFCTVTFQVWLASIAVVLLLGVGLKGLRLGLVIAGLAGSLIVGSGVIAPLDQLIENRLHPKGAHADEYAYRFQLWPAALREASHGPFLGQGPGMFNQLEVTGTVRGQTVVLVDDNTITSKLVETGYVGVFSLLALLALVARRMWWQAQRWRAWAGLAALAAWCVMAMSVELLVGDQALFPSWFLLGMLSYSTATRQVDA